MEATPAQDAGATPQPPEGTPEASAAELPPPPMTAIPLTNEIGMAPVPAIPGLMVPPLADPEPVAVAEPVSGTLAEPQPPAGAAPAPTPVPAAAAPASDRREVRDREAAREARPEHRRRDERGRRDGREGQGREGREAQGRERAGRNGREEKRSKEQKNIQDLLKEGQEVIVQVAKDPIGTKGARITSHISLPGRHLVFTPTVDHIGISRRIEKDGERRRLREIVDRM